MSAKAGPVTIVGGGPAGASAAVMLARRGRHVTLFERTTGPHHKVCGEFLSWEGRQLARRLGAALPHGAPIDRLRLVTERGERTVALPGEALGLSRFHLDESLLSLAAAEGAEVRRGVRVRALREGRIELGSETAPEGEIILATGKTELRGCPRPFAGQRVTADLTGFKVHLRLAAPQRAALARTIELHRWASGYAGLQPIEEDKANLCLLVASEEADRWADPFAAIEAGVPALARRLAGAESLYDRPLAISRVPYGMIRHARIPGALAVGDQQAVIHSFTGDGLSLALASGMCAGVMLGRAPDPHVRLQRLLKPPVHRAARLYQLLNGSPLFLRVAEMFPTSLRVAAKLTRVNCATVDNIVTEFGT